MAAVRVRQGRGGWPRCASAGGRRLAQAGRRSGTVVLHSLHSPYAIRRMPRPGQRGVGGATRALGWVSAQPEDSLRAAEHGASGCGGYGPRAVPRPAAALGERRAPSTFRRWGSPPPTT